MLPPGSHPREADEDRRARFRVIFEQELDYVWITLRRLGVHARDLEDLAQEVFVSVYRRLDDYDTSRPLRPWLFAFAFRCASDWRRLARHRVEVSDDPDRTAASTRSADDAMVHAEDLELALEALQHVEIERRAVLVLHEFDECPMKEIVRLLAIPLFTGYSRLRVGREEFTAAVRRLRAQRGKP
jgi:RNA polymerase sigma-70 factor (ECF subfamily)